MFEMLLWVSLYGRSYHRYSNAGDTGHAGAPFVDDIVLYYFEAYCSPNSSLPTFIPHC